MTTPENTPFEHVDDFTDLVGSLEVDDPIFALTPEQQNDLLNDVRTRHNDELINTGTLERLVETVRAQDSEASGFVMLDPDKPQFTPYRSPESDEIYLTVYKRILIELQEDVPTATDDYRTSKELVPLKRPNDGFSTASSGNAATMTTLFEPKDIELVTKQLDELDELRATFLPLLSDDYISIDTPSSEASVETSSPDPYRDFIESEDNHPY